MVQFLPLNLSCPHQTLERMEILLQQLQDIFSNRRPTFRKTTKRKTEACLER